MAKRPTLLQHFRSFAYQNNIRDFDKALEYFTVFGGTGWDVDTSKSLDELIEEKVLRNYEPLHKSMTRYTHNNPVYHMLLSLVALGVNHEHDAFKKAKVGRDRGEEAIDYLVRVVRLDPEDDDARNQLARALVQSGQLNGATPNPGEELVRRADLAKPDALIMHPGPMNRGVEIAPEVADGPRAVILDQVTNGVAVRMALLYLVAGGGRNVDAD